MENVDDVFVLSGNWTLWRLNCFRTLKVGLLKSLALNIIPFILFCVIAISNLRGFKRNVWNIFCYSLIFVFSFCTSARAFIPANVYNYVQPNETKQREI